MVREAKTEDITFMSEIIVSAWQTAFSNIIDPEYPKRLQISKYRKIMNENLIQNKEKIFVYDDGIVKGFISGKDCSNSHDCEVVGLYIHPDYQQKGIGSILLQEMKQYFKERDRKRLLIWTLKNAYNNTFYTKHGGIVMEKKELKFGQKVYQGIGFIYDL